MLLKVVHAVPGRIRYRTNPDTLRKYQHNALAGALLDLPGIRSVKVNPRTGSILVHHTGNMDQASLTSLITAFSLEGIPLKPAGRREPMSLGWSYIGYQIYRLLQPLKLKPFFAILGALPYFRRGLMSLSKGRMDIDLLDASAIGAALIQGQFKSASTLTMLLKTGDYLERWAKERTTQNLVSTMSLNVGQVWIKKDGTEIQIPYSRLQKGDLVIIRAGAMIPVDGCVESGEALVNEASLTGEPLPVRRTTGHTVHAGTVLEEGELTVNVHEKGEDTRFEKIIHLIQESESTKAVVETHANEIADKMVPFNFALAGGVYAATRNLMKASTALSVDYSCAIKLSTPLVFLSAMKEGLNNSVFFKGGATLEMMSQVDTVVFDKTGTLTNASPKVAGIVAYNGYNEREVLKISACLEEHFPHPVARAIVNEAWYKEVEHQEEHTEVKYIVAHGIATLYRGKHTVIGSRHFINDDEGIDLSIAHKDEDDAANQGHSVLYLAVGGKLAGLILIDDPVRQEAGEVIRMLRATGVKYIYMLTGDNRRTAKKVADELGITAYKGEVLPHEKADLVKLLQEKGRRVAFVGDGMNDSPAMSVADLGIAMKGGADLAQEVADITLRDPSLYPLVIARILSQRAMKRIQYNNYSAVGINTVLMFLGISGLVGATVPVWLHNLTTIGLSANSMRQLLGPAREES